MKLTADEAKRIAEILKANNEPKLARKFSNYAHTKRRGDGPKVHKSQCS